MRNLFSKNTQYEVNLVSFRDLQSATIGMLLGVIMMIAIFMNPAAKSTDDDQILGNMRVEIFWPNNLDVDIDLWCKAPGDVPVGYSNGGGKVLNLVRDDLGNYNDLTPMNYEIIISKGNPPGEYICNVHWFSNAANVRQVPVEMVVTYRKDEAGKGGKNQVIRTKVTLMERGEERTVIRWKLDTQGNLLPDSINSVQHPLREFKRAQ